MPSSRRQPESPAAQGGSPELVQQLLTEKRDLLVRTERLRLELEDERARAGGPDPGLRRLEDEVARLRRELSQARLQLEMYEDGLNRLLDRLATGAAGSAS